MNARTLLAALTLIAISVTGWAAPTPRTSAASTPVTGPTPASQDISCSEGSYVTTIAFTPGLTQGVLSLNCRNLISNSNNAPNQSFRIGDCSSCIPTPRGARMLNNGKSASQQQCVYFESVGATC